MKTPSKSSSDPLPTGRTATPARFLPLFLVLLTGTAAAQTQQKPPTSVLLQKAIFSEETDGDLKDAMASEFCLFVPSSQQVRRFSLRGVFETPIRAVAWAPKEESFLTRNQDFNGAGGIFQSDTRSGETAPVVLADHTKKPTRDGQRLVYVLQAKPGDPAKSEVWSLSAAGGAPVRIALSPPQVSCLSLHPDGPQLAFQAGEPGQPELWVMENLLPGGAGERAR
jgi:hypothetical protein